MTTVFILHTIKTSISYSLHTYLQYVLVISIISLTNPVLSSIASLAAVTEEASHCKTEYDTLLREMRDPEVRAFFGVVQVALAKDTAKGEWTRAERCA
jgi:uncharacterized protein YjgD (DUF1641 family)